MMQSMRSRRVGHNLATEQPKHNVSLDGNIHKTIYILIGWQYVAQY